MTNPFVVNARVQFPNGPGQAQDNLTAMPSNFSRAMGVIGSGQTQYYDDNIGPITILTNSSGVSATGTITCYIITSEDNVHWTDNISPTASGDQTSKIVSAPIAPGGVINATAASTIYTLPEFSIASALGFMPSYWSIVIRNQSGTQLSSGSANFDCAHSLITFA
jgi:hypothetical protein